MNLLDAISLYLNHKRALGYRFRTEEGILRAFLKRVGNIPITAIETEAILAYLNNINKSVTESWFKKHQVLSRFFKFLLVRELVKISPVPHSIPKKTVSDFVPYIYSTTEIKRLLDAISDICGTRVPIDADVLRTLILLLYAAGLRLGEALKLNLGDVDLQQNYLRIRETKFFKDRLVPMSSELGRILVEYIENHRLRHATSESTPLFCFCDGARLSQSATRSAFRRMRLHAGMQREGGARRQPRLHDLRHTFAVHHLLAWYRNNENLQVLLPKLAIYMGHVNLSSTQHYLTMTPELLGQASLRFERYANGE